MASHPRLSLTSQPVITADVIGTSMLHYTDGVTDLTQNISSLGIGAYDVALVSGTLQFTAFNPARADPNYLGSINVSVAGQLTAHVSYGRDRKWEVWNADNQKDIVLKVGDWPPSTSLCGTMCVPTPPDSPIQWYLSGLSKWQLFAGDASVRGAVFLGEPTTVFNEYSQGSFMNSVPGPASFLFGVGWNVDASTVVTLGNNRGVFPDPTVNYPLGRWNGHNFDAQYSTEGRTETAKYEAVGAVGLNYARPMLMGVRGSVIIGGGDNRPGYPPERGSALVISYRG